MFQVLNFKCFFWIIRFFMSTSLSFYELCPAMNITFLLICRLWENESRTTKVWLEQLLLSPIFNTVAISDIHVLIMLHVAFIEYPLSSAATTFLLLINALCEKMSFWATYSIPKTEKNDIFEIELDLFYILCDWYGNVLVLVEPFSKSSIWMGSHILHADTNFMYCL